MYLKIGIKWQDINDLLDIAIEELKSQHGITTSYRDWYLLVDTFELKHVVVYDNNKDLRFEVYRATCRNYVTRSIIP